MELVTRCGAGAPGTAQGFLGGRSGPGKLLSRPFGGQTQEWRLRGLLRPREDAGHMVGEQSGAHSPPEVYEVLT